MFEGGGDILLHFCPVYKLTMISAVFKADTKIYISQY